MTPRQPPLAMNRRSGSVGDAVERADLDEGPRRGRFEQPPAHHVVELSAARRQPGFERAAAAAPGRSATVLLAVAEAAPAPCGSSASTVIALGPRTGGRRGGWLRPCAAPERPAGGCAARRTSRRGGRLARRAGRASAARHALVVEALEEHQQLAARQSARRGFFSPAQCTTSGGAVRPPGLRRRRPPGHARASA